MNKLVPVAAVASACALCGALPGSAAAQGGLLGSVGSIVGGTTDTLTSTLEQVLGGGDATLPTDELGDVLVTITNPSGAPPASGGSSSGGSAQVVGGGGVAATGVPSSGGAGDARAPLATVRVVSRLKDVARTRKLRVEVRSDEAGVVAFSSTIRPGLKRRGVARAIAHRRSVIHLAPVTLAFRRPGVLTVDLRLKAGDAAKLGRSRNGRMSIGLLTADLARNQATERLKRHLRR